VADRLDLVTIVLPTDVGSEADLLQQLLYVLETT
jgi:hypothetical protein